MIRRRASAALIAAALHSQMWEKRPADGIGKFDGSAAKRLIISFLKCLNIDLRKRLKSEDHRFLRKAPPNGILSEPARMGGDSYRKVLLPEDRVLRDRRRWGCSRLPKWGLA